MGSVLGGGNGNAVFIGKPGKGRNARFDGIVPSARSLGENQDVMGMFLF